MNCHKPLVSVLIPVYNVEKFVSKAVLSIINQTYRNLQIIIIDDCSTDKTFQIVSELAKVDDRILLLKNDKNAKIVKSLNFAFKYATGEYIARMDGDDLCESDRIEKMVNFLLNNPEYSLVSTSVKTIDENDNILGYQQMPDNWKKVKLSMKYASPVLHIWLAKYELYTELKGYREIIGVEDYDFLLRAYSLGYKFINITDNSYSVRLRSGNSNATIGFRQRVMTNYVLKLFKERLLENNDSFSENNLNQYYKSYRYNEENYNKSMFFLRKSIIERAKGKYIKTLFLLILSMIMSKFQFQYVIKRLIFKLINYFY